MKIMFPTLMVLLLSVVLFTGCSSDSQKPLKEVPSSKVDSSEENDGDSCVF
ncbi:hypothetical protein [Sulfurimonas sp.]